MAQIYDFSANRLGEESQDLSDYRGKALLVVNTARKCGFTPQYEGLEALYKKYRDRGLEILGFPCNQFMKQEPGDAEEIASFCQTTYGVSFPMFARIDVNGPMAHPLYQYLTAAVLACWALNRSNGTSPNFSLARKGWWSSDTPPRRRPKK